MRLDLFLALRFLREGRAQAALIVGGAGIGVAVFFFLTALVGAVERGMVGQTLDVLPHVVVRPRPEAPRLLPAGEGLIAPRLQRAPQRLRAVDQWQAIAADLAGFPGVRAVAAVAAGPALAVKGDASRAVTLLGVEPEAYAQVLVALPRRLRQGAFRLEASDALVGVELASELGLSPGDTVRLSTQGETRALTVAGVFDLGTRDANLRWVFTALRGAQALHALPGGASALELRLDDPWTASAVAARLRARTGLRVESWMETNGSLLAALRSQRGSTRAIQVFVGLAAVAGIASVLVVSVVQRQRQIGILRAMGLSRAAVQRVFLAQGAAIGLLGAAVGSGIGTILALLFETSAHHPDGSPMYPVRLEPGLYAAAALLALAAGLLAAVAPARRAAALDPAEAIRRD